MTAYLLIALTVISVAVCYYVAKQGGLSQRYWLVMAVLFGPLAIPFVFLAKSKRTKRNGTD